VTYPCGGERLAVLAAAPRKENPMKQDQDEAAFQAEVIALCEGRQLWPVVVRAERWSQHTASNAGFPDLVIYGRGGTLHRELKTMRGMTPGNGLRPAQTDWKYRLLAAGHDWAIWTPSDLASGRIQSELQAIETPNQIG
jgi:hypothetical protein